MRPAQRVVAGRYRLDSLVGEGGYGEVFAAYDGHTERLVALKVFKGWNDEPIHQPELLLQEARRTAALAHPNIVRVFDAGIEEGVPFLVMELLEGQSIEDRLALWGPLSVGDSIRIAVETLKALAHVHSKSILHADLKPSNVFLTHDHRVKLIDFGISRALTGSEDTGRIFGTPPYMAPEVILGQELDERVDIYEVGLLLYAMLAGRPPYRRTDETRSTFQQILAGSAPSLGRRRPFLPSGLAAIVARAMAVDPDARFESAAAMRDALTPYARRFRGGSLSDLSID